MTRKRHSAGNLRSCVDAALGMNVPEAAVLDCVVDSLDSAP